MHDAVIVFSTWAPFHVACQPFLCLSALPLSFYVLQLDGEQPLCSALAVYIMIHPGSAHIPRGSHHLFAPTHIGCCDLQLFDSRSYITHFEEWVVFRNMWLRTNNKECTMALNALEVNIKQAGKEQTGTDYWSSHQANQLLQKITSSLACS